MFSRSAPRFHKEGRFSGNVRIIALEDTLILYLRIMVSEERCSLALISDMIVRIRRISGSIRSSGAVFIRSDNTLRTPMAWIRQT